MMVTSSSKFTRENKTGPLLVLTDAYQFWGRCMLLVVVAATAILKAQPQNTQTPHGIRKNGGYHHHEDT